MKCGGAFDVNCEGCASVSHPSIWMLEWAFHAHCLQHRVTLSHMQVMLAFFCTPNFFSYITYSFFKFISLSLLKYFPLPVQDQLSIYRACVKTHFNPFYKEAYTYMREANRIVLNLQLDWSASNPTCVYNSLLLANYSIRIKFYSNPRVFQIL